MKIILYVVKNRVFPGRSEVNIAGASYEMDKEAIQARVNMIEEYDKYSAVVKAGAFEIDLPQEKVDEIVNYFKEFPAFDKEGRMIFYNKPLDSEEE